MEEEEGYLEKPLHVHASLVEDPDEGLSEEEKASIIYLRLIPWLSLLYLAAFLDRTNVGNAKIEGLQKALDMTNNQYNATLTIFFVSYSIFEPLTNVLLKRTKPSIFISAIIILWGICMTTMGLVHNFSGLMAARWFLGLAEAGLFPGVSYYLSCWYKRSEFGVRMAIFFSAAALAGSFGGLLAAAISKMNNVGGKAGWSWIFILEGLATIILGVLSFWLVVDFPDNATFLSELDRAIIYMGADGPLYAFSLFLPTIISELGYSSIKAQLLSVPPYAVAAILTVAIGYIADRTRARGLCNIIVSLLGAIGFSMLLGAKTAGTRYAGTFLGAMGIYPCISNTISWTSNNVEGECVYKRGVTLGIMIGWGNLNGIVSSNIYRGQDAPINYPGHGTVLSYLVIFLLCGSVLQTILLRRENNKRRRGERDYLVEGLSPSEIKDLGDMQPGFIYTT
ncbi:hypothetical protein UA08_02444 [Talaromyces atroroseus]|uniref:Major facilitator superfamily (MFS) profile domain-containing protein n=1 Tax=Talaromyces atroroseus TaxID=1441469 RepID=A0A225B356_TALAT|nr:hypothetical protein UA08_02444 [Talaromyces atroroseus]OKL61716.1 hypothetical protein UA08_02444 [Talaromyces atroroseus]